MKTRLTSVLLVVSALATAPLAMADTDQKQTDTDSDDVHVTVTAGRGRLGVAVIQISPELRAYLGAPTDRGVLVNAVRPDSPAARAGLRVGDVVLEVDSAVARNADDMLDAMSDRKKGEPVALAVVRDRQRIQLTATLQDDPGRRFDRFGDFDKPFAKGFEWRFPQLDADAKRALDDARRRIDELERRLDKLERD